MYAVTPTPLHTPQRFLLLTLHKVLCRRQHFFTGLANKISDCGDLPLENRVDKQGLSLTGENQAGRSFAFSFADYDLKKMPLLS